MILVYGTICIDRLRRVPVLPSPGGYVEIEDERVLLGGEAANTANALLRWQHPVSLAGNSLGSGPEAHILWDLIREKGLPTQWLKEPAGSAKSKRFSPVCDIYVTPDGERTMFGRGFASALPDYSTDKLPLRPGDWFTVDPNMAENARHVVRVAMAAGMRAYVMDFVGSNEPLLARSYWQSSTDWAGHRNNMQRNVQWVKEWVSRHGCFSILSDGPNGFVFGGPEYPVRAYPPFPAPVVVDTTGAGDLFRAGMLHGLDSAWSLPDCLRFASVAGCLKCRALGATTDVPSVEEILAHIGENPDVAGHYG